MRYPARCCFSLVLVLLAATALASGPLAAEAKNYAYFLLQGRIADSLERDFLEGATVRLTAGSDVYETTTDERGVFLFEKLPVQVYDLTILTAEGEVIRYVEKVDLGDQTRSRLKIRLGKGAARKAQVGVGGTEVEVDDSDRPPRWRRFWTQFAIVAGIGLAFAL
jgi:hypothetical protein